MLGSDVLQITQEALWMILLLAGPPVVVAAIVGILIAFFQAATQLQEQTFQYAAKFFAIALTLFIMSGLMGRTLFRFADRLFTEFPVMVGG
ncbi:MAG: type III secretion system export apparatus subunit SctS [Gammaproteobacteria bacterium]|nr:type III secretion system export apparatus subunit SctS [Gammaproteobacteria bacterium]